jgi:hypothetical protein
MIRFTWLQARTQNLVAVAGLVGAAVVAAVTGPHLAHLYDTTVATCTASHDCDTAVPAFLGHDNTLRLVLDSLVRAVPAIIGIFWGAPLVARELEAGTYRLVWTQSVTRTRWLAVKLLVVGLAGVAVAGLFSLLVTWWARPLDRAATNQFATFDQRNVVPVAYAALAFTLGVTAGLLIRRALPAMATALVAFAGIRLLIAEWVRPALFAPHHTSLPTSAAPHGRLSVGGPWFFEVVGKPHIPNAWVLSSRLVDLTGRTPTTQAVGRFLRATCHRPVGHRRPNDDCFTKIDHHFHLAVTYIPSGRYWPLQGSETAIYLAAALALGAFCFYWIGRRRYA